MDSEESPLHVLSRAATMVSPPAYVETLVQSNCDGSCLTNIEQSGDGRDEARTSSGKDIPSTKWRKDRRQVVNTKVIEAPLDFSKKHANMIPPPSYDQTIQSKMSRPSVIQSVCAVFPVIRNSPTNRSSDVTKDSTLSDDACDPAIDEHFRRSLGKDYSSIFSKDRKESNKSDNPASDSTGLTVDDHFAKALGDTWIKLKEKENQKNVSSAIKSNNNHLEHVKDLSNGHGDVNMKRKKVPKDTILNEKRRAVVNSSWVKT